MWWCVVVQEKKIIVPAWNCLEQSLCIMFDKLGHHFWKMKGTFWASQAMCHLVPLNLKNVDISTAHVSQIQQSKAKQSSFCSNYFPEKVSVHNICPVCWLDWGLRPTVYGCLAVSSFCHTLLLCGHWKVRPGHLQANNSVLLVGCQFGVCLSV